MLIWVVLVTAVCFSSASEFELRCDSPIFTCDKQLQSLESRTIIEKTSSFCFDKLGCFERNGTFKYLKQFLRSPESVSTHFLLYTRNNRLHPQFLHPKKPDAIKYTQFNSSKPIKFIVHGFTETSNLTWIWDMKNAFLEKHDVNVIVVDWSLTARCPNFLLNPIYYLQAIANAELVGADIALFIYLLKDKFGVKERNLHLLGYSLGAHVAGFAGKEMQKLRRTKPARITGLDPSGPMFEECKGMNHLWRDDADFVDVIHTNGDSALNGGIGFNKPIGHADFYPNGGKRQPGCPSTTEGALMDIFIKRNRTRTCNHERSVHLFIDSILRTDSCQYLAYSCANYEEFTEAKCMKCGNSGEAACGQMGDDAVGSGIYYLLTKDKKPYCGDLCKLKVEFAKHVEMTKGKIVLTIIGANGIKEDVTITKRDDETLEPGTNRTLAIAVRKGMLPLSLSALYRRFEGWLEGGTHTFALESVDIENARGDSVFKTSILLKHNEYQTLTGSNGPNKGIGVSISSSFRAKCDFVFVFVIFAYFFARFISCSLF